MVYEDMHYFAICVRLNLIVCLVLNYFNNSHTKSLNLLILLYKACLCADIALVLFDRSIYEPKYVFSPLRPGAELVSQALMPDEYT